MNSIDLREQGFSGFVTVQQLMDNPSLAPKEIGVYAIIRNTKEKPHFNSIGTGGHFKGKNPNVAISILESNWVEDSDIVYIGKAGKKQGTATLYSRLGQYMRFGQTKAVGHWGGRYIWQLADNRDLLVCWKPTNEEPRLIESIMLQAFTSDHGKLPFANIAKGAFTIPSEIQDIALQIIQHENDDDFLCVNVNDYKGGDCVYVPEGLSNSPVTEIDKLYDVLEQEKSMVAIVPTSFLTAKESFYIRKKLVNDGSLKGIYIMPSGLIGDATLSFSFIHIQKNDSGSDVIFVNGLQSNIIKKTNGELDIERILGNNMNDAFAQRFSYDEIKANGYFFDSSLFEDKPNTNDSVRVRDANLLMLLDEKNKDCVDKVHVVSPLKATSDINDFVKDPEDFSEAICNDEYLFIDRPAIFIFKYHHDFPVFVKASESNPVCCKNDYLAFSVNTSIADIAYLCLKLDQKLFEIFQNESITSIDADMIYNMVIDLPAIDEQKKMFAEIKKERNIAKEREAKLKDKFEASKKYYIDTVRSRKHNMSQILNNLYAIPKLAKEYVYDIQDNETPKEEICKLMDRCINSLQEIGDKLKTFSKELKPENREIINIDKFLFENYLDGPNWLVDNDRDDTSLKDFGIFVPEDHSLSVEECISKYGEDWLEHLYDMPEVSQEEDDDYANAFVYMDKEDLQSLFDNIVNNAISHGFTNDDMEYQIEIELSVDTNRKMFKITVYNDGNLFPEGMTKERYGILGEKAGKTGHTGEGGYIVKSILERYGGDYDILSQVDKCEYGDGTYRYYNKNVVTIYLPIYYGKE